MFKSNLKTAIRSLLKNKGFAFLNVFGLALGMMTCIMIVLYVKDELSFDRYNVKADRIFRVNTDTKSGPTAVSRAIAAPAVAPALLQSFPEIEKVVRILPDAELIKNGNELVMEKKMAYADPGFFEVFTIPMLEGDSRTALQEPNSIVITESVAKRYFNKTHVVGQLLQILGDDYTFTSHSITGVIRDIPSQSHFNFDFILTMEDVAISKENRFSAMFPFSTYILLKPGTNIKNLEAKFSPFVKQNLDFYDALVAHGDYIRLNLTPLTDIHLNSNRTNELGRNGSMQYIRIFSATALFILLIACINFINLSTARSSDRAREVGVRKVLGSSRTNLITQFLLESMLVTVVAGLIALMGYYLLLPLFNNLSGKQLEIIKPSFTCLPAFFLGIIILVGLLAGSYPAMFLSGLKPIQVLKGKLSIGFKGRGFRSFLVVFQFSISILLIVGTLVIYNQLRFIQTKDLGFKRNQVIVVKNMNSVEENLAKELKAEVKRIPGVSNASLSSFLPTGDRRWNNFLQTDSDGLEAQFWPIDEDYIPTMGMNLVKGRNFSNQFATDSLAILMNESALSMIGLAGRNPLNKKIYYGEKAYHIIGVVRDFHYSTLRDHIFPLVMMPVTTKGAGADNLIISASTVQLSSLLANLKSKWKALFPQQRLDYSFMDEDFDALYRSEQRMGKIFVIFTSMAVIIACLGLFGLAAYSAERRNKEISIRKVLGADMFRIVSMLSKDFLKLVLIAIIMATPIAGWLMQEWLENFAYRTQVQWWVFAIAGMAVIVTAFITISFQSFKAANANPVDSLRAD